MSSSAQEPDLLSLFVHPVHHSGLHYLVGGSVAAMHYSEPRLTVDVDVPVVVRREDIPVFSRLFAEPDYYCPPPEIIEIEVARECGGHFNVIHVPTGLKADFYPSNRHPLFAWAWEHKHVENTEGGKIFIAPPEYVILWKLMFFREGGGEKHLRDIRRMIEVLGTEAATGFLQQQVADLGLQAQWQQAQP